MIPPKAVEAAAKAIHRYDVREGLASTYAPNEHHRAEARAALEAAAPNMLADAKADALKEAGELIEPFSGIGLANGATRGEISNWLKARAEAYRGTP